MKGLTPILFFLAMSCSTDKEGKIPVHFDSAFLANQADSVKMTGNSFSSARKLAFDSVAYFADSTIIFYWERGGKWVMNTGQALPMHIMEGRWRSDLVALPLHPTSFSLLTTFFPGRYYHIHHWREEQHSDDIFTCWNRLQMKSREYISHWEPDWPNVFPDTAGNETRIIDTVSWTQPDGKKYFLASFSSSGIFMDFLEFQPGHFVPAALGLALFESDTDSLRLKAFDPCVMFCGQWSTADEPGMVITGKHSFLIQVNDHASGAGSPLWKAAAFFALEGDRFVNVTGTKDWGIVGYGHPTEWSTEMVVDTSEDVYPDIRLLRKGIIAVDDSDIAGSNIIPHEAEYLARYRAFRFYSEWKMHYELGKYGITCTKIRVDTIGVERSLRQ